MTDEQLQEIVSEVLRRLAKRLAPKNGDRRLIVVFTGATVAFGEALDQVRSLLLDGYRVQVVFSPGAEHLLSAAVRRELESFPNAAFDPVPSWLSALKEACAVVVPMLSLNTVSKLSSLIADNPAGNLLLHALLMGKPLVMARDGADPDGRGREELGFHRANIVLTYAMRERLKTIESYGCLLTDTNSLAETVRSIIGFGGRRQDDCPAAARGALTPRSRIVTVADVRNAHHEGIALRIGASARITPLARDTARQLGVSLLTNEE